LARDPRAYIRPSPSGASRGGVARRTAEAILAVEAAGFDTVIVETVGVGQSETAVADMVDMFVLLLAPGGGDDLQGIKRGVIELADLFLVTKADGDFMRAAKVARADYQAALQLIRQRSAHWKPKVLLVSALENRGLAEAWETIEAHRAALGASGELDKRRVAQRRAWLLREIGEGLMDNLRADKAVARLLTKLEKDVADGGLTPPAAARRVLAACLGSRD
jgi:LAO/AO transport system kinase